MAHIISNICSYMCNSLDNELILKLTFPGLLESSPQSPSPMGHGARPVSLTSPSKQTSQRRCPHGVWTACCNMYPQTGHSYSGSGSTNKGLSQSFFDDIVFISLKEPEKAAEHT